MQNKYLVRAIFYSERDTYNAFMVHSISSYFHGFDDQTVFNNVSDPNPPVVEVGANQLKHLYRIIDFHDIFRVEYRKDNNFIPVIIGIVVNSDEVNLFKGERVIFKIFNFRTPGSKW